MESVSHVLFLKTPDLPAVPESILVPGSGLFLKNGRKLPEPDAESLDGMVRDGRSVPTPGLSLESDEWVVLTATGPRKYPRSDADAFLGRLAKETLESSASVADPEARLRLLGAAAALRGFDAGAVVKALSDRKKPGESLFDTYLRNRLVPK